MTDLPDHCTPIEAAIARHLIDTILARGFSVSVFDGEETTVRRSKDRGEILAAMCSTDSDAIRFRSDCGRVTGAFVLIYGNGIDLVSDYSDTPTAESIARESTDFAESFES